MRKNNRSKILAIDAGTTGVRAVLFNRDLEELDSSYSEIHQYYPQPGWVEHDPEEIWYKALLCLRRVSSSFDLNEISGIGITNQRETVIAWERQTLRPLHRAIVWQCRRSTDYCAKLKRRGWEKQIRQDTGLYLDPYFSASKMRWLLDHSAGVRQAARRGDLCFGTVDSWLIARLTRGRVHATDHSNASRTMLYSLKEKSWSATLLKRFEIPQDSLPEIRHSSAHFGLIDRSILRREIPICGVAGDQQAALFGQGCWEAGEIKITYGTGCFLLVNVGKRRRDLPGFLSTIAVDKKGLPCFAVEGAVFIGGAVVQWLRDALEAIPNSAASEKIARSVRDSGGVYFIPAFAGLGAPYWDPQARGAILGLSRGTGKAHIVRAALESIAYQNAQLLELIRKAQIPVREIQVDGGACRNNFLMQFQANLFGLPVARPGNLERTALGAAALAAIGSGVLEDPAQAKEFHLSRQRFSPKISKAKKIQLITGWKNAVSHILTQD